MSRKAFLVNEVCIRVRDLPVVNGVSLCIYEGESVGIVGPNGAGKTSLARGVAGLAKITSGSLHIKSDESATPIRIDALEPWQRARKGVIFVSESRGIFEGLRVRDNLLVAFSALRLARNRANDFLEEIFFDFPILKTRSEQQAGTLSGGERKVLAIARATLLSMASRATTTRAGRFDLLVIDEPTHGLHPSTREHLRETLVRVSRKSISLLIVEQSFEFAMGVADRCWIMEQGRLTSELT